MSKVDIVSAGVAAIQVGQTQVLTDQLGVVYDAAALEQKASDGTLSQADLDAAVAAAQAVDAQALADAKAASDAALAGLQSQLSVLATKEGQEASVIAGLQASKDALAAALATLAGLFPVVTP